MSALALLVAAAENLCDDCERVAKRSFDTHRGTTLADWKAADPEGYAFVRVARERIENANLVLRGGS